ncbi:hypothetical protein CPU12_11410 [Malaciobacter molluscorum LMG 25693]|uniref:GGDEF domain-containing protein n=1 Tax=Malaciobacter molluscorum LMG 25693 TaxID=870501 RepID=A0A2G1DFH0_9BACT|nr:GGDEF domain-containing protein [Malaciobacter molluscorum]AXX91803.1 hypothetical protein AMOL_0808 [Malaciobacter molluscorum LMG 25693]PHO17204.1 hypothetical protein CPU12_11410 [Malaciobacter molluscorum LMG 25693]
MLNEIKNPTSYLDIEDEDITVSNIINKYELNSENDSFLFSIENDYKTLIEYISNLYIKEETLPADINHELNYNINFKRYLIKNIKTRIDNIFYDKETFVFKEIVTIVNLLSFGKNYKIFENYINYNLENLSSLFRDYEEKLEENKEKEEEFNLIFEHYTLLIETINVLCKINSNEVERKKTINIILEILTETINILKFKLQLNENRLNILNNILGKLLFYYAHIPFIETENKSVENLIEEFYFYFEKAFSGYELSKSTNFGNSNELNEYKIYLNTITTLLSNLIYKLQIQYDYNQYKSIEIFNNILELYKKTVSHTVVDDFKTVIEFKEHLINNYVFIYCNSTEFNIDLVINDFFENKSFDNSNISIIYCAVLYSSKIENDTLVNLIKKFTSMPKFENDYLEFYKLNICDVIINKLIRQRDFILDEELVKRLIEYINKNSIASHLISTYTKIFLSLSLYYSYFSDFKSSELSKNYFAAYKNINGEVLLKNEYKKINDEIFINYGKALVSELNLTNKDIDDSKYLELGEKSVSRHIHQNKINKTYYMNQKFSNLITTILNEKNLDDEKVNRYIGNFVSEDIFHGLANVFVEGLCHKKCDILDLGYETIIIELFGKYKLKISYSTIYKNIFNNMFSQSKDFIEKNITTAIITYQRTIPMFFDKKTGLRNVNKLQKDLEEIKNDFIFIEFYLNNIDEINTKYGYAKADEILKSFANIIDSFANVYRMAGPKFGVILPLDSNIDTYIKRIKSSPVSFNGKKVNFDITFAVSWGDRNNILEKSAYCMAIALKDENKYYEFK